MATIFKTMLGKLHCESVETVTGSSAGTRAINLIRSEEFDVVVTDRKMPDIGGFTVAEAVRQVDEVLGRRPTPVLMVTVDDGSTKKFAPSTQKMAKDLNVSLLMKPLNLNKLGGVLHMISEVQLAQLPIPRSFFTGDRTKVVAHPHLLGKFVLGTLR
jgi:CheY-like chemotaxis protein